MIFFFVLIGGRNGAVPEYLQDENGDPARFTEEPAARIAARSSFGVRGGFGYLVIETDSDGRLDAWL